MAKMIRPNLKSDLGKKSKEQRKDLFMQIRYTKQWIEQATDPDHVEDLKEHLWRLNRQVK
jgi:hypothetical protein